tara:strand:+ start:11161 stop:12756 length:1596 start_codon:yes stop_codon:yes gene_type:complete
MIKFFFPFFIIFSFCASQSSNWWIFFNDKSCSKDIKLSNESINRRLMQNIQFDYHDLPVCDEYISILKKHDLKIRHQSRWLNAVSISLDSPNLLEDLWDYDFVKYVRPVAKMIKSQGPILYARDIDLYNTDHEINAFPYGISFNQIDMLGGVALHDMGFLGSGINIAVFDAGFTGVESLPIFENVWNNNQIIDMYDFVDNDDNVFNGSVHGTMVLSTMAGYMLDSLVGSAIESNYILLRTEDSNSETLVEEDNWAAAAEYADSVGAHIINSSLGYTILYDDTLNSHSYTDMDGNSTIITIAADLAASRGILVVNSAGNSGNSDWYYIGAPADGDSVLSVGAVNSLGQIAAFSSRGPTYDGRIKPNICAQGVNTVVADLDSTIRYGNGTSFSAPIISGLSACLWEALSYNNLDVNNMMLFSAIQESAHLFNAPNDSLGYGIPDFYQAYLNSLVLPHQDIDFKFYPNPFQDNLVIYNGENTSFYIDVFDLVGAPVYSRKISAEYNNIMLSDLNSGLYLLKIRELGQVYSMIKL